MGRRKNYRDAANRSLNTSGGQAVWATGEFWRAGSHLPRCRASPITVKNNILICTFSPHPLLSQKAFSRFVQDNLVFGNAGLEKRSNRLGGFCPLTITGKIHPARSGSGYLLVRAIWHDNASVWFHKRQHLPSDGAGFKPGDLRSAGIPVSHPFRLLNKSATLFRRKYYIKSSHAGFIMYMTDTTQN